MYNCIFSKGQKLSFGLRTGLPIAMLCKSIKLRQSSIKSGKSTVAKVKKMKLSTHLSWQKEIWCAPSVTTHRETLAGTSTKNSNFSPWRWKPGRWTGEGVRGWEEGGEEEEGGGREKGEWRAGREKQIVRVAVFSLLQTTASIKR